MKLTFQKFHDKIEREISKQRIGRLELMDNIWYNIYPVAMFLREPKVEYQSSNSLKLLYLLYRKCCH